MGRIHSILAGNRFHHHSSAAVLAELVVSEYWDLLFKNQIFDQMASSTTNASGMKAFVWRVNRAMTVPSFFDSAINQLHSR